jgi:DNA-binding response OmpR family regulator
VTDETVDRSDNVAPLVLVVDDDDSVRSSLAAILRVGGFTVTEAKDGLAAHRLLSTERFDCAIVDIRLPGLDGLTVLTTVPHLPQIILVSGQPADTFPSHWLSFVAAYIEKPVEPEQLLAAVTSVTRRSGPNPHEYRA